MLYEELRAREAILEEAVSLSEKKLKNPPEGKLRAATRGSQIQYYLRKNPSDINGTYIPKSEGKMIVKLAEKDYYECLRNQATTELKILRKYLKQFPKDMLIHAHEKLGKGKRGLVTPFCVDDETYAKEWEQRDYISKGIEECEQEFYTGKGERVRSKSEIIIADRLAALGIPYHYEELLVLNGGYEVYPDFTLLDVKKRRVIYLEHFGMMDNPEYVDGFMWKISHYAQNGIFLGHNLIATFEQSNKALSTKELDELLKAVFEL